MKHGIKCTSENIQLLLDAFPSKAADQIVVDRLFDVRLASKLSQAYNKVYYEGLDMEDVAVDASGYTGNFRRSQPRGVQQALSFTDLL